jgi:Zn-dependent protease with chaperone function
VFVFTGILPICQDDSGIASVLGHEIAHNVAHHMAEKLSSSMISRSIWFLAQIALSIAGLQLPVDITGTIINLVLEMPHSRRQESEADLIGLCRNKSTFTLTVLH